MDQILAIVIPVFGLVGLGYLAGWTRLLGDGAGDALSEFVFDLRHPRAEYLDEAPAPLLERNPLLFWQVSCGLLAAAVLLLLARLAGAV